MDSKEWSEVAEGEFLEFERIPKTDRLSNHPDLCALLYLERIKPGEGGDILGDAQHDIVYIDFGASILSAYDVLYLSRCGVHYDTEGECLAMFT